MRLGRADYREMGAHPHRAAQQMLLGQPVTPPVTPQKAPQKFPVQLARPVQAAAGRSPLQALQPQPA